MVSSKKPSPPPSHASQNTARTVRKQPSRILGTPSQQDSSRHTNDQPLASGEDPTTNNQDNEKFGPAEAPELGNSKESAAQNETESQSTHQVLQLGQSNASPRRESSWSIWGRKTPLNVPSPSPSPSPATESKPPQPDSTAASIKSAKSVKSSKSGKSQESQEKPASFKDTPAQELSPEAPSNNDQSSIKSKDSTDAKDRTGSWLSWRKPSLASLKKSVDEDALKTTDQLKSVASDAPSTSHDSSQVTDESQIPKERTASWSLWKNSTSTPQKERPSLSNILLSGNGEAILFEPTTHSEAETQKKPSLKKPETPNRVLPEFEKSLPYYSTASSIINNINRLRYTLGFDVEDPKHLYRTQTPSSTIKKVLIIGVHGFFPTRMIRPLIGEPTGTSIKFANEAEKAVWRWAKKEKLDISVQKLALEKEGKIFERVEFFYEVMKKWKKDVDSADYIYFAAHSQGCPVSILLLSRLIEDAVFSLQGKRISLLCMAGVNNGPFYGVDQKLIVRAYSSIENDSLMELFQFQNFESVHSRELLQALRTVIAHNVKITFVGSINDQLVPLYSSTCLHVRHPNIFRATYIDGSSKTPEFVSRAVSIANHLHNIGLSDHGVIKEISNSLGGPLTGGGHSRIYNDPQVYDLALEFSLYTSDLKYQIPLHFKPYAIDQLGTNPFHLPWCMRGLLFEARAHFKDANEEIQLLFEEFENWKPETKQLKDMKYRLNGIKSKL